FALSHSPERFDMLREEGITPIYGDLDRSESLSRIAGIAHTVLHLAPPQNHGKLDIRTRNLLAALIKCSILPYRMVYISTTGVYGDCSGECAPETRPVRPQTARALRRLDAEKRIRRWGRECGVSVSILRVPGIYSKERISLSRLEMPVLQESDDVYTNHIHAEDLAGVVASAIERGASGRIYNVCDDSSMKMGDYFDLLADRLGFPHPERMPRTELREKLSETMYSFMSESRRLCNRRMKGELGVRLKYPKVSVV
ncbi:MAG TPA: NAD-dependent epimerase/dehydratase family protein, partial [Burkholderiales bacterium]|nr:NAD-dependent epimerase/dehydratase family protein [Burkholderiales bacterium]